MNISSNKNNDSANSPKTPGGISKSFLTPCRRLGLSRKWRKSGVSPFISPLGSSNNIKEVKLDSEIRKRKKCITEVEREEIEEVSSEENCVEPRNSDNTEIDRTPTRTILPRKKRKSRLIAQKCLDEIEESPQSISEISDKNVSNNEVKLQQDFTNQVNKLISNDENMKEESIKQVNKVTKLSRKNSINKLKILNPSVKNAIDPSVNDSLTIYHDNEGNLNNHENENTLKNNDFNVNVKEKIPNTLTKECMVVIQKKIFKRGKIADKSIPLAKEINKSVPQSLFDSDSDDVPLCDLNKQKTTTSGQNIKFTNIVNDPPMENIQNLKETNFKTKTKNLSQMVTKNIIKTPQNVIDLTNKDPNDDFIVAKKVDIKKLEKITLTTETKKVVKEKPKINKLQTKCIPKPSLPASSLCDEDDDFDYNRSKTILIKKTYDKVSKPLKAKSTGSITQKDIDDITARIESKKTMLLAKALTDETKELRGLIKKWKVGCQTALMELIDLMKKKVPDQNIELAELLQMLKIPPALVEYDSDSDAFNTPDDSTIILSALKLN